MLKHARWMFVLCVVAVVWMAPSALGAGKRQTQAAAKVKTDRAAQGWVEVAPQVLERRLGARVEHLGYGEQGLAWTIGEYQRQLEFLEAQQASYPSDDLARVIEELRENLARARRDLIVMSSGGGVAPAAAGCSSICYSATADAYPLSSTQGVGAVATAQFNSTCGFSGDTFAYAFARATLNGTTTTVTQSDPKSGTSANSYAAASVSGGSVSGISCYSTANSYAQSSALGIYYSTSTSNDQCPPPANLSVSISGTTYESFSLANCRTRTWTSSVSGGSGGYTYQWLRYGSVVGTGSSYTGSVCYYDDPGFTLTLNVSSGSVNGSASHSVTVFDNTGGGCFAPGVCCFAGVVGICP